jgi:hypothetical protein
MGKVRKHLHIPVLCDYSERYLFFFAQKGEVGDKPVKKSREVKRGVLE